MKQNTEQLKKEFEQEYWKRFANHFTIPLHNDVLPFVWNFFLPHLISSDEIKREAVKAFVKSLDFWSLFADKENITSNDVEDYVAECLKETLEEYLIQSKEGGE